MATLAEIQAELRRRDEEAKARDEKRNNGKSSGSGDNAQYPFWDTKVGEKAVTRWLPDGDDSNLFPWVERQTIELTFDGTVGGERDTTEAVKMKVPCPTMFKNIVPGYDIACQITAHIRPWWKPKDGPDYKKAQKYYRKQSWLMQGFVTQSPFVEENVPENPIRRFTLTKQIFNQVFKAYNGTEYEYAPHDFDNGTDFYIEPRQQGEYKNWEGSDFARRTRSLSAEERAAVEQYGLFNLKDFVGKVPTQQDADAMYAMFLDSLEGRPYDFASYKDFYRPFGVAGPKNEGSQSNDAANTSTRSETPADSVDNSAPATGATGVASADTTDDLIARIRRNAMK